MDNRLIARERQQFSKSSCMSAFLLIQIYLQDLSVNSTAFPSVKNSSPEKFLPREGETSCAVCSFAMTPAFFSSDTSRVRSVSISGAIAWVMPHLMPVSRLTVPTNREPDAVSYRVFQKRA